MIYKSQYYVSVSKLCTSYYFKITLKLLSFKLKQVLNKMIKIDKNLQII